MLELKEKSEEERELLKHYGNDVVIPKSSKVAIGYCEAVERA